MSSCPSMFEGMPDVCTETRTQVFSYTTTKFSKFCWSAKQNFSAARWLNFGDNGRQIFTTGRQFCRPVSTYFRPCTQQMWPRNRSAGDDSIRILRFFWPESKICEKPDLDSLFVFGSSRSLRGLYKCHCDKYRSLRLLSSPLKYSKLSGPELLHLFL